MSRDFRTAVIARAVHDEGFRQLWQRDPEAAADAMEMTYDQDDLRELQALSSMMTGLDADASREFLQGLAQQPQDVFGSPQRTEE